MSLSRWTVNQTVIHPHAGTPLSIRRGWIIDKLQPGWISKHYAVKKKVHLKRLHTVWFCLCHVLKMTKLQTWRTHYSVWQGLGMKGGGRRALGMVMKGQWEGADAVRTAQNLDCGGGYRNPPMWSNRIKLNTHPQLCTRETGGIWMRSVDCMSSISWLWYCTTALRGVTMEETG